jgi:hypothetical protein
MGRRIITDLGLGNLFLETTGVDLRKYVPNYHPLQPGEEAWFENLSARPYAGRTQEGIRTTGVYVVKEKDKKELRFPFDASVSGFKQE